MHVSTVQRIARRMLRESAPTAPHSFEQIRSRVLNGCLLVALLTLLAICGWLLWDSHNRTEMTARQNELNMAEAVASTVRRDLESLSQSVNGTVDAAQQAGIWDLPKQLRQLTLFDSSLRGPQFSPVLLLSKDGTLRAASSEASAGPTNLRDSDFFQFHQADPTNIARVTDYNSDMFGGMPMIALSRRISDANGNFDGIVVGGLRASYYQNLFKTFNFGAQGSISLLSTNRRIIARVPINTRVWTADLSRSSLFERASSSPSGSFFTISPVDGERRLFAYRVVPGFPFIIGVSSTDNEIFAEWRKEAFYISSALIVLAGLMLMLMRAHWRELLLRRRAEICARQSAHELSVTNRDLEKRIEQEILSRKETMEKLTASQRLEALGQLAGGIAHDINNVLQTISGACQLLQRRAEKNNDITRLMSIALAAADRGSAVTSRLLVFARRAVIKPEPVDTRAVLEDLQELLSHTLGTVVVELELEENLPFMLVDRMQLETVVINLATNARDAMPGGGRLTLSVGAESGIAGSAFPEGSIRLRVSDTGTGMSEDVLAHAAEPFFSTKGIGKGTGLGLSMAKGFADQSRGRFHIASKLGVGTTVTLWLPACEMLQKPQRAADDSASTSSAVSSSVRVLIVDDSEPTRDLVGEALGQAGFDVQKAESGLSALAQISAGFKPDLLLTDLSMPGMDGVQLIRAVRRQWSDMPAIILTGNTGAIAGLAIEEVVGGRCSILQKPIRVTDLSDHIHLMLNGPSAANALLAA